MRHMVSPPFWYALLWIGLFLTNWSFWNWTSKGPTWFTVTTGTVGSVAIVTVMWNAWG